MGAPTAIVRQGRDCVTDTEEGPCAMTVIDLDLQKQNMCATAVAVNA
jgi:hypothetical protein